MNLDELIAKLEEIRKTHGGSIRVHVRTSYHDSDEGWDDVDDPVRKVVVDDRRKTCCIDGEEYHVYV
jgi:hypothetical protein